MEADYECIISKRYYEFMFSFLLSVETAMILALLLTNRKVEYA